MAYVLNLRDENGKLIPIPAIKGEKGDSYILTDADKQEIANIVAASINTASLVGQANYVTEEQVQTMIANAIANAVSNVQVEDKEAVIINFKIEDIQFQAEEGMTWREWVNSEYNNGVCAYNAADDTICYVEYSLNVLSPSNTPLKGSDRIISGYFYYLS